MVRFRLSKNRAPARKDSLHRHGNRFSAANLIVYLAVFASIGGYILYHSFAAAPACTTTISSNLQSAINSAASGNVICLHAGTYGSSTTQTSFSKAGITVTSFPGETATIVGWPYVGANNVTLSYLNFDLNNVGHPTTHCAAVGNTVSPSAYSLQIDASNVVIEYDNIYQTDLPLAQRAVGIGVGWSNESDNVTIRNNKIHDVGVCPVEDHGIYLNHTSGAQVYQNWIYSIPAGTGIQLWDGTSSAHIYSNVIDGAADCFDLGGNTADSNNNLLEHNLCTNMVGIVPPPVTDPVPYTGPDPGQPLFDYWGNGVGTGNIMRNNLAFCTTTTHCSTSYSGVVGVSLSGNITGNPLYTGGANHDYRVSSSSPATTWGLWDGTVDNSSGVLGDDNNDGHVNITDLSIFLTNYGGTASGCDFNSDGHVDITDLSILLSHYGT